MILLNWYQALWVWQLCCCNEEQSSFFRYVPKCLLCLEINSFKCFKGKCIYLEKNCIRSLVNLSKDCVRPLGIWCTICLILL